MTHWNYRLLKSKDGLKVVEVIYDKDDLPMGYCEENSLTGSQEEIIWTLKTILKDIKKHPTPLTKKDFTGTIDGVTIERDFLL